MAESEIPPDVREAGRTAFLQHRGLTSASVDAAIDAAVMADRAARAPDPSRDEVMEALQVCETALQQIDHAHRNGPWWFTNGESALWSHVRIWLDKGFTAVAILHPETPNGGRD